MEPNPRGVDLRPLDDEQVFRRFLSHFYTTRRNLAGGRHRAWEPPTDVYETPEHIVLKVCIPGVQPDQVAVKVNGEVITVCGVRRGADPSSVVAYHQMEINNGYFERRIAIHKPFDPNGATARYENGFLYVLVPKASQMVRHVLTVRIGV